MIYLHKQECIYIHIPKTGGSSFTRIVAPQADLTPIEPGPVWPEPGWQSQLHLGLEQHSLLANAPATHRPGLFQDRSITVLAHVRNPYTWYLSLWRSFYGEDHLVSTHGSPIENFSGYLDHLMLLPESERDYVWGGHHQVDYLRSELGVRAYVGTFEDYGSSTHRMCQLAGIRLPDTGLPWELNRGAVEPSSLLSQEDLWKINTLAECDFEEFGYQIAQRPSELTRAFLRSVLPIPQVHLNPIPRHHS